MEVTPTEPVHLRSFSYQFWLLRRPSVCQLLLDTRTIKGRAISRHRRRVSTQGHVTAPRPPRALLWAADVNTAMCTHFFSSSSFLCFLQQDLNGNIDSECRCGSEGTRGIFSSCSFRILHFLLNYSSTPEYVLRPRQATIKGRPDRGNRSSKKQTSSKTTLTDDRK